MWCNDCVNIQKMFQILYQKIIIVKLLETDTS